MATHVSHREDLFPAGTSVSVYTDRGPITNVGTGAPSGTAISGSPFTVAGDGSLTVTGLTQGSKYVAYASSPDRYMRFSVPGPPTYRDLDLATIADGDAIGYDETTNTLTSLGPVVTTTDKDAADGVAALDATRRLNPITAPLATSDKIKAMGRRMIPVTVIGGISNTNGDATVTCASTVGLEVGMELEATGIPQGTKILSITDGTTFEMTANATSTGTGRTCRAWRVKTTDLPTITNNGTSSGITSSAIQNTAATLSTKYRTSSKYLTGQSSSTKYFQGATMTPTVTLTSGDATVTCNTTNGMVAGAPITGSGIPNGTTVLSITNGTTFEMSANATASGAVEATIHSVNQQGHRIEFDFNGDEFEIRLANCYYRIWVDEEPLNMVPVNFAPGLFNYLELNFGVAKNRRICLEMEYNGSYPQFYGIYCHPKWQVMPPSIQSAGLVYVGDSGYGGIGSTYTMDAFPVSLSRLLGFAHFVVGQATHGGTGFVTDNTTSNFKRFIQRIDDAIEMIQREYDEGRQPVLMLACTLNDSGSATGLVGGPVSTAIQAYITAMRAEFADLPIILIGPWYPKTPSAGMLTLNTECSLAAAAAGVPYVNTLKAFSNPTSYLFNGTGTFAAVAGDGNADIFCAADGVHGSPDWHRFGGAVAYGPLVAAALGVEY